MPEARRIEILNITRNTRSWLLRIALTVNYVFRSATYVVRLGYGEGNVITLGTFSKIFMPDSAWAKVLLNWWWSTPENKVQTLYLCVLMKITVKFFQKTISMPTWRKSLICIVVNWSRVRRFREYMPEGVWPPGRWFVLFLTLPEGYDAEELFQLLSKRTAFASNRVLR